VVMERLVAEMFAIRETPRAFPRLPGVRHGHFDALHNNKRFKRPPDSWLRVGKAIFVGHAEQVGAQVVKGQVSRSPEPPIAPRVWDN